MATKFQKAERQLKTEDGYKVISQLTSVDSVEMTDGSTLTSKISSMDTAISGKMNNTVTHLSGDIATSEKGANNGVATLGSDGKIPSSQLPSFVDDVLEYSGKSSFPTKGESGKIYVDTSTNLTYRWSGTAYVEISQSLALGETSSTAYAGDKGKANADAISALQTTVAGKGTYSKPSGGIPKTDLASAVQTSLGKADTALQEHQSLAGYATETWVNNKGYTTNTGTVTQVKVGTTGYNPTSGVVSLPAYPTTLPASDVQSYAKTGSGITVAKSVPSDAKFTDTTYSAATKSAQGLMSAADKTKLDGIASGANAYSLPTASSTTLGGVKVGTNLSISNGVLSATDTTYSDATTSAHGLMTAAMVTKLNGIAAGANAYSLPAATSSALGGVKTSTGISNSSGTISVSYGTTAGTACQGNDSRLSDSRNAKDVYSWAKASSKPSYAASEISYTNSGMSGVTNVSGALDLLNSNLPNIIYTGTEITSSVGSKTTVAISSVVLPKGYQYLVFGGFEWSTAFNDMSICSLKNSAASPVYGVNRSTAGAGNGQQSIYIFNTTDSQLTINLMAYNGSSTTRNLSKIHLFAIRL